MAGVGIGSLYQYYPNKLAILRDLQEREHVDTLAAIGELLANTNQSAQLRLECAVRLFLESEKDESEMRDAMRAANLFFRNPEIEDKSIEAAQQSIAGFFQRERALSSERAVLFSKIALGTVRGVAAMLENSSSQAERETTAVIVSEMIWKMSEES